MIDSTGKSTPKMVTELLKKAVAEKGQSGVARETGLTQSAIHRYLKGVGEPTTKTLKKLADYFGVSIWELRDEAFTITSIAVNDTLKDGRKTTKNIDLGTLTSDALESISAIVKSEISEFYAKNPDKDINTNGYILNFEIENGKLVDIKIDLKKQAKESNENSLQDEPPKGGGKTPSMVVELLKKAVSEKSQSAVARETGLTLLTLQRYLKGIGEPRQKKLERLADYFGVSVTVLRGDGIFSEKNYVKATGRSFSDEVNAYEKFAVFMDMEYEAALEDTGLFGTDIYYIHLISVRAKELLRLPEEFSKNFHPAIWLRLTLRAQKVLDKYHTMLAQCDKKTREYLLSLDAAQNIERSSTSNSGQKDKSLDPSPSRAQAGKNDPSPAHGQSSNTIDGNELTDSKRKKKRNADN